MWHDIVAAIIILVISWGLYSLNEILNPNAKAKQIIGIVILVVGCLFLITPLVDVIQIALSSISNK